MQKKYSMLSNASEMGRFKFWKPVQVYSGLWIDEWMI